MSCKSIPVAAYLSYFNSYELLHSSVALGKSHEASEASLSHAVAEATEIKRSAADALTSKVVSSGFSQT